MIPVSTVLNGIRSELRAVVVPALDEDEYAISVIYAALGILGDLALQVEATDDWARRSAEELNVACLRWAASDAAMNSAEQLEQASHLATEEVGAHDRPVLLAAVERLIDELWSRPQDNAARILLADVRAVLAGDLARQLERIR